MSEERDAKNLWIYLKWNCDFSSRKCHYSAEQAVGSNRHRWTANVCINYICQCAWIYPSNRRVNMAVKQRRDINDRETNIRQKPVRNNMEQTAEIWTCFSQTHAYPRIESGRNHNTGTALSRRILWRNDTRKAREALIRYHMPQDSFVRHSLLSNWQADGQTSGLLILILPTPLVKRLLTNTDQAGGWRLRAHTDSKCKKN